MVLMAAMFADRPAARQRGDVAWRTAGIMALAVGCILCAEIANYPIWNDEIEHLHAAWLMTLGQVPFRDFWQHHPPALWLAMGPLLRLLPQSVVAVWAFRIISLLLVALAVAGAGLWGRHTAAPRTAVRRILVATTLLAGSLVVAHLGPMVRAETLAGPLLVAGLVCGARGFATGRGRWTVLSGICWGAACVITPKVAPFAAAWPIGVALGLWPQPATRRAIIPNLMLWGAGCAVPVAWQLIWLVNRDVLREFIYWCFSFNQATWDLAHVGQLATLLAVVTPVLILWAMGLRRTWHQLAPPLPQLQLCLTVGGLLGLAATPVYWPYSAWGLFLVTVPLAVVELCEIMDRTTLLRSALLSAVLVWGCVALCLQFGASDRFGSFARTSPGIQQTIELAQGRAVLCLAANHPVFCEDATPIGHPWQIFKADQEPRLHAMALAAAQSLAAGRPDLVQLAAADDVMAAVKDQRLAAQWQAQLRSHYRLDPRGRFATRLHAPPPTHPAGTAYLEHKG